MSDRATESGLPIPFQRPSLRDRSSEKRLDALTAELREALSREQVLLQEKHELSERQVMLAQEFEHRLINGLQLIVSLLSMQSRTATGQAQRTTPIGRKQKALTDMADNEDWLDGKTKAK